MEPFTFCDNTWLLLDFLEVEISLVETGDDVGVLQTIQVESSNWLTIPSDC